MFIRDRDDDDDSKKIDFLATSSARCTAQLAISAFVMIHDEHMIQG